MGDSGDDDNWSCVARKITGPSPDVQTMMWTPCVDWRLGGALEVHTSPLARFAFRFPSFCLSMLAAFAIYQSVAVIHARLPLLRSLAGGTVCVRAAADWR